MSSFLRMIVAVALLSAGVTACGTSSHGQKKPIGDRNRNMQPKAGDPKAGGSGISKGKTDGSGGDPTTSGGNTGGNTPGGGGNTAFIDEPGVPAYMLTSKEAAAIKALVDPYITPQQPKTALDAVSSQFGGFRDFTESFVNRALQLSNLKPGRTFAVSIIDADDVNAYADGYQRIGIHTKTVESMSPGIMLLILCHEMAHSTKNHASVRVDLNVPAADKAKLQVAEAAAETYLNTTFDQGTNLYIHNVTTYRAARAEWDKAAPILSTVFKGQEAEADAVGMMICAELGMPPADFTKQRREFTARLTQGSVPSGPGFVSDPNQLKDGEKFDQLALQQLVAFLFPIDSHPSDAERDAQSARLEKVAQLHLSKETLYKDWLAGASPASGGVLSLLDGDEDDGDDLDPEPIPPRPPLEIVTSMGRVIHIHEQGCHH